MRTALLCLSLVFAVGCKVANPNFCDPADGKPCTDGGVDAPEMCSGSDPCDMGVCKEPQGICVQCLTNAECSAAMPVCDTAMNKCNKCTAHSQCPSDACLPDGTCANPAEVLYVANPGSGTTCTMGAPCADVLVALAVAPPKAIIRVKNTITSATIIINNRDLMMLGDPNTSVLNRTVGDVLTVNGTSKVRLYDLKISGASGNTGITALSGHTGELELQRCTVNGNRRGIQYDGTGTFILSRSTVSENFDSNAGSGGVAITANAKFDITNNFIFRNGNDSTALVGGISISSTMTVGSRLEFNTIVDNDAVLGSGRAGGVFCDIAGFVGANNLIARNEDTGTATLQAQDNGNCDLAGSLRQTDFVGLLFVKSEAPEFNYHLKAGSGGVDMATGGTLMTDFDGEPRPNGTIRDMGADELY